MRYALEDLLNCMSLQKGSDLHLIAGAPPRVRQYGDLVTVGDRDISAQEVQDALYSIMPSRIQQLFERQNDADFAYERNGISRYRVNIFKHLGGMGAVFRAIATHEYTLQGLGLPDIVSDLCLHKQGLILVTGKTGSGKSTTLAAMVNAINERISGHILTVEDPVEFVHHRKNCLISQREVGEHTPSFARALRSALREDPDVIMVGELRDLETISLAVTAAETGILVIGTMHTKNAGGTIDRIINAFPAKKQPHMRAMLSASLRGVISQQLIKRADVQGRVAAVEILINTPTVANVIREGKTDQIQSILQSGNLLGMQSMDSAIRELLELGVISAQSAYEAAHVKSDYECYVEKDIPNAGAGSP